MKVNEYCETKPEEKTGKEGRVKVNEYCGTKPEETTGKGRESEGKRALWNQSRGNDRKRRGE